MSLPPRHTPAQRKVAERASRPARDDVAPSEQMFGEMREDWSRVAVRPDLYSAPDMGMRVQLKQAPGTASPLLAAEGGGSRMPEDVQTKLGTAFGTDFSNVRIHEGAQATGLGALAYTQGTDIHFAPGQYQPHDPNGQQLLGHELAHVVQQAQGRVQTTTQAKGANVNDDPALEWEADEMGAKAARGEAVATAVGSTLHRGAPDAGHAVLQAKLYVIGEHHHDSDLRIEQEKVFCNGKFGPEYYQEQEYKVPGTQVAADSRALKGMRDATIPFYLTPELLLNDSDGMSAKQLDEEAGYISDFIDKVRLEFEELTAHPDQRFEFEDGRLKTMMPRLEALDDALTDLRVAVDPDDETEGEGAKQGVLLGAVRQQYKALKDSVLVLHKITPSHGKRMRRELDKKRSEGMAKALIDTGDEVNGVWKVGDDHIPEIRDAIVDEDEEHVLPQVIAETRFNEVFLKWFEEHHKEAYDEYVTKREAL